MPHKQQLDELKALGDGIVAADKADKRIRKAARHENYRKKRIAEATDMWDKYNKKLIEVLKFVQADDPCLKSVTDGYNQIYKEYTDRLLLIKDKDEQQDSDMDLFEIQRSRLESLKKVLSEVELKQIHDELPSPAFIKIKSQRISEMWQRIEVENDNLMVADCDEPCWYQIEYNRCEELMERSLMFLQENVQEHHRHNGDEGVKLGRVEIQKFSGDYFSWVTFRDLFKTLVIDNKKIPKSQKMQLLKTHVTGEAETLIRDLTISETNFDSAWKRLQNRYDNERVVVCKLINKLMGQSPCKEESKSVKSLLDTTDQVILALKNMGRPVDQWDDWVIVTITQKLSENSHKDWEQEIGDSSDLPTWEQLKGFLEKQFRMMERVEGSKKRNNVDTKVSIKSYQSSIETTGCSACSSKDHTLYKCPTWIKMTPKDRWALAKKGKWCFSCLKIHQGKRSCDREKPCKKCTRKHSTWLHITEEKGQELKSNHRTISSENYDTLLATAVIQTKNATGQTITLRALVDSGSEGSMITEEAAQRLRLRERKSDKWVTGLNGNKSGLLNTIQTNIKPRFESTFSLSIKLYIMKTLTKTLPSNNLVTKSWQHIKDLVWADPKFHRKGKIDVLLGMDVIVDILKSGLIKGNRGQPMAQETEMGWIISGKIDSQYSPINCHIATMDDDMNDLQRFWEIEEIHPPRALTMDEQQCEQHYVNTYRQAENGEFVVCIPFKTGDKGPERLGESRGQALARFLQLEKRLVKDEQLRTEYIKVIQEYIDLNQVKEVTQEPDENKKYYIPHHAVVKPESLTTKTRVVFDASAKTSSGISLNECMYTGAKQQRDLMEILLKWRTYKIVMKADVEKMYRMIKLDEQDQKYHTFFWRANANDKIKEYQMTAVTFGTAAAPFLATRTLKQLAIGIQNTYPLAAACLEEDFYVDDFMGGSHSVERAIQCKDELITALSRCNFKLRKWSSNSEKVLASLPAEITEKSLQKFTDKESTKALGLIWVPQTDKFRFDCDWFNEKRSTWTKRQFLAETSKIFDPMGWLAPVTVNAKLMMQEIWLAKLEWDDPIPKNLHVLWSQFRSELHKLGEVSIDRWISYVPGCKMSLHGFGDASEKAYSAVVYARIEVNNNVKIKLLVAKTRVAPVKSKLTVPRLELNGAALTAALMDSIVKSFNMEGINRYLWTDSMITLGWLNGEPQRWKTFVANRVAEIQAYQVTELRYVPTEQNPADCASRGLMPNELINFDLWWNGPAWLSQDESQWPNIEPPDHNMEQRRAIAVNMAQITTNDSIEAVSSWNTLKQVAAYASRWRNKNTGMLTATELIEAEKKLVRQTQEESFLEEMAALKNNQSISKKSVLKSLNIFLDTDGIIRVGGRLENANISFNKKHPMVLPAGRHLTKLIIHQIHLDSLHGGPKLMRSLILKKFWIIQAKRMISTEYKRCVTCRRFAARPYDQQMGELPQSRVTLTRAFHETGIDYAGPIEVKISSLRTSSSEKGYVAVFVCMSTKAVHLELVSDQSTAAFLSAFDRFVARRSLPARMHSDNGGTFVGATNELDRRLFRQRNQELAHRMVSKGVEWNFIPEGAPNFGGLWERAVRSMKDHMKKSLKTARLTFEEYATLLCQTEACLNSRPICALSNNVDDINALTPGHFLVGSALLAPPEPLMYAEKVVYTRRWNYVQKLQKELWDRWNAEYLNELQQRHKWQDTAKNIQIGELVVVKNEDLPPRHWLLGRIEEVHPGKDGQIRVATVRIANNVTTGNKIQPIKDIKKWINTPTKTTTITRSVRKLCPITLTDDEQALVDNQKRLKQKQPNKGKKMKATRSTGINMAWVIFGILMLTLTVAPKSTSDCVRVLPFQHNAGIYFENLGRASMTRSEWTMVVYFDLQKYYAELKTIEDATTDLRALCQTIVYSESGLHCTNIVELLQMKLDEVHQMNILLKMNKQATEPGRTRRSAPLNIVGWIGHELFGIMDEKRSRILERKIWDVKVGHANLMELIKNQTSIVELTVNLMKTTQEEVSKGMGSLTNALATLKNETDLVRRKEQVLGWAIYTSLLIERVEKIQRNIINMLTDLQQGHISSYLFTPQQFKQQLNTINDQIPIGSKLPLDPQHDMRSFYEVMRGRMRVTDTKILLEIVLPLVSIAEFQVFYLIPVPFQHNGEHLSIIPESKYLLITLQRDTFYQMDDHDLDECIKPQGAPIICQSKRPINNIQSSRSKCERELLSRNTEFSKQCRINVTKPQDTWIQLKETNIWLYGLHNKTNLNVVYDSEVDTITLQGSGRLEVSPGCEVIQHGFTMIGQTKVTTNGLMDFQPSISLSRFINDHPTDLKLINVTFDHSQQFQQLYSQLDQAKTSVNNAQIHHQRHYVINGTVSFIIIALILFGVRQGLFRTLWSKWSRTAQNNNDVELHDDHSARLPIEAASSITTELSEISVDNKVVSPSIDRHGPGGCPFRT